MKNLLLGALLSSTIMFGSHGYSSHHSSHHSSHISHDSSGSHMSSSHPAIHSTPESQVTESRPYTSSKIRTSSVEYNTSHRYYYYPLFNHNTNRYDTIKGESKEDVQIKVNKLTGEDDTNWIGVICLCIVIGVVGYVLYKYGR